MSMFVACSGPVILNKIVTFLQQSSLYQAAQDITLVRLRLTSLLTC
jgi:hypothetical protein